MDSVADMAEKSEKNWRYQPEIWINWLSHYCFNQFYGSWLKDIPLIFMKVYKSILNVILNIFILCRDIHGIATKKDRLVSCLMILLAVSSSTVAISSDIYSIFNRWQWRKVAFQGEDKLIQFVSDLRYGAYLIQNLKHSKRAASVPGLVEESSFVCCKFF